MTPRTYANRFSKGLCSFRFTGKHCICFGTLISIVGISPAIDGGGGGGGGGGGLCLEPARSG